MVVDTRIYCTGTDCIYNDEANESCTLDSIKIVDTFYTDVPAACDSYEEKE